jgi:membrane-associated protein
MILSLDQIIPTFTHYRYLVIFPLAVLEGPIVTFISGFLVSLGLLPFFPTYVVIVTGDLIGDSLYYAIGRYGREGFIGKYLHYVGITFERIKTLEKQFENNLYKIFVLGKFTHGIGSIVWVASGLAKVPFRQFLFLNAITTAIKSLIILALGFYFGKAYEKFEQYLHFWAWAGITLVVLYIILLKSGVIKKFFDQDSK